MGGKLTGQNGVEFPTTNQANQRRTVPLNSMLKHTKLEDPITYSRHTHQNLLTTSMVDVKSIYVSVLISLDQMVIRSHLGHFIIDTKMKGKMTMKRLYRRLVRFWLHMIRIKK